MKFRPDEQALLRSNSKYAHRAGSGKFITMYPVDEQALEEVLGDLDEQLAGAAGPYILSDLRWNSGPLYVRYGGFQTRTVVLPSGLSEFAIEDRRGNLVPDKREPAFYVPDWVELPPFLEAQRERRTACAPAEFPFKVHRVLHFSNGGGVYQATDLRNGQEVVLKEARPHAGLDALGTDAVTRLSHEHAVLQRLRGLWCVPQVHDYLICQQHHFLVMDYVEGKPLWETIAERILPLPPSAGLPAFQRYTAWALDIFAQVDRALQAIHDRGVVLGDLHARNVLVPPHGPVVLIDFEFAGLDDAEFRVRDTALGFEPPAGITGPASDDWQLCALGLNLFLAMPHLLSLDPAKLPQLLDGIAARFPIPADFRTRLHQRLAPPEPAGEAGATEPAWTPDAPGARAAIVSAILASTTPQRDDRLFPGDIAQFASGGLNLAYGAAGVLYALHQAGAGRFAEHEAWLVDHVRRSENPQTGFYLGLHGIAYALHTLGCATESADLLDRILSAPLPGAGIDLMDGLPGMGLSFLHFARHTGDPVLLHQVERCADLLGAMLAAADSASEPRFAGLARGWTGAALFYLRLYEHTGDQCFLDLAAQALRRDLAGCAWLDGDVLHVRDKTTTLPYLAGGSVGIGLVLQDYLRHRHDEEFDRALTGVVNAASGLFYLLPGLFHGVAGILEFLCRERQRSPSIAISAQIEHLLRLIADQAIRFRGGVAFTGHNMFRLSTDLATGSAGVLLALTAARTGQTAMPFFQPEHGRRPSVPVSSNAQLELVNIN